MFGSVVIDVAIGMAFVFLLLSLIASTLQEFLSSLVQARAANLHRGLTALFSGGHLDEGVSFVERIYNHGLIQGLYRDERDFAPPAAVAAAPVAAAPVPGGVLPRTWFQKLMRVAEVPRLPGVEDLSVLPAYIPSRTFAVALIDLLNVNKRSGAAAAVDIRDWLRHATADHPKNKAFQALLAISNNAGDSLVALQSGIEQWYNDAMDRVSGWYKKNNQYILLGIGLIMAVALNVNSIQVAQTLWFDRDVRQNMVQAAGKVQPPPAVTNPSDTSKTTAQLKDQLQTQVDAWKLTSDTLLPIGWSYSPFKTPKYADPPSTWGMILRACSVFTGWLMTAFAISLGASFWFDTLNKFMVVRNTVKPQEKSGIEGQKDAAGAAAQQPKQPSAFETETVPVAQMQEAGGGGGT